MSLIEIYTRQYCGYCDAAKALLQRKGAVFHEIDVTGNGKLRSEMVRRTGGPNTLPQIFIGATHVGGCDELYALEAEGGLDRLLAAPQGSTA